MSRGLGRAQRTILEVMASGPMDVSTLALHAGTSEASTRRALRRLAAAGQVQSMGYASKGGKLWGLPDDVAARLEVWPPDREARLSELMGARFARSFRRALIAML